MDPLAAGLLGYIAGLATGIILLGALAAFVSKNRKSS